MKKMRKGRSRNGGQAGAVVFQQAVICTGLVRERGRARRRRVLLGLWAPALNARVRA